MNKKWEICSSSEDEVKRLEKKYNISNLLATVLVNRGITEDEQIRTFLDPVRTDFHDPFNMPDMGKAVDRITAAMKKNEKVVIYGDYDVDGITSTTVLKKFLEEHGLKVDYKIPNRLSEGYGLNIDAIKEIAEQKYNLIITVDCGISGIEEIDYATKLGIDVIVTDHHEPLEEIPKCVAVIDCKREDSKYECNSLAGCGVVFKLIQAISIKNGYKEEDYLKYLDIVCVGTISDIVPLVDENRVIAKLGLKLVNKTKNLGLKSLIESTGYKETSSSTVSFGLAPRINACGRMGYEEEALKLFLTDDLKEAQSITSKLNDFNKERQSIEKKIYDEAIEQIEAKHLDKNSIIIVGGENWHHGVIGIVSSKITELYYKPSILVCFEEDGTVKGSGRSIAGFDLHGALNDLNDLLIKFGGHEMAIGLSLKKENYEEFCKKMQAIADESNISELLPVLKIDKEITINNLTIKEVESLNSLEPFGELNKTPYFLYKNLKIDSIRAISEGKHLKLTLKEEQNGSIISSIGFNQGELAEDYRLFDKVDVVGTLEINEFNNKKSVQINLKDIRKSI